jgi:hypothetical protein
MRKEEKGTGDQGAEKDAGFAWMIPRSGNSEITFDLLRVLRLVAWPLVDNDSQEMCTKEWHCDFLERSKVRRRRFGRADAWYSHLRVT